MDTNQNRPHPLVYLILTAFFATCAAFGLRNAIEGPTYWQCFAAVVLIAITSKWYALFWNSLEERR